MAEAVAQFRARKDRLWKEDKNSPLLPEQKEHFTGLNYFPENPALSLLLPLDDNPSHEEVRVKTTGGDEQIYHRVGKIRFVAEKRECSLPVLEDHETGKLYLIFKDATTGRETYENGRMLMIEQAGDKLRVDFNYAYNPYSAYNDNWDCPITPEGSTLPIPIRAGEKGFSA